MWDGLGLLLVLSTAMAVASFVAGSLPLSFAFSPRQMRVLTAFGTGVLVGTSLIVIIPEGVETLYAARPDGHSHAKRDLAIVGRTIPGLELPYTTPQLRRRDSVVAAEPHILHVRLDDAGNSGLTGPDDGKPLSHDDAMKEGVPASPDKIAKPSDEEDPNDFEPHAWIGISIILGFILMYLIDHLPKLATSASQMQPSYISLDRLGLNRRSSEAAQEEGDEHAVHAESSSFRPSSITTGLVIHAAADGIALGATSTAPSQKLGFVVFLALMIHKAPAAFGLTAALLKQGLTKRRARTHLIVFSLAAPLGALATWAAAHVVGGGAAEDARTEFATGLLLLFSGGTFLYVAMHTMQEAGHSHTASNGSLQNGYADPYQEQPQKAEGTSLAETLVTVGGMLLPIVTQVGHAH